MNMKLKKQFYKDVEEAQVENVLPCAGELFKEEDFAHLPKALRMYISNSGYIGKSKMSCLSMEYRNVDFAQGKNGPKLKIDYTQYNFVNEPCRLAFIDSSLFRIPFEGYDYYRDGRGGMKGVIAKFITLFDQTGADMDKACLVTYLAECLFAPSALLQDYVAFEEIGDYAIKAVAKYKGAECSGIFHFNEKYEMVSFTTEDRAVTNKDGSMEFIPWSAECGEYRVSGNGLNLPTRFRAVWHYPDGDFVYFDGAIDNIIYA